MGKSCMGKSLYEKSLYGEGVVECKAIRVSFVGCQRCTNTVRGLRSIGCINTGVGVLLFVSVCNDGREKAR